MKWVFLAPWREWIACNSRTKGVVAAVLVLLLLAYLPTLQYDYVTQDQWRAFRYSVEGESSLVRGKQCGLMISQFYVQTGRPFVWFGECVEHAIVSRISDFRYVRPIVFGVVLLTVLYLGTVLAPLIGGFPLGVSAAAVFVVTPGYSFMYLQGMPAIMVLVSILLSAMSFFLYSNGYCHKGNPPPRVIFTSGMLFIVACLIYPAYAFIVIALILIELGFGPAPLYLTKARLAVNKLLFYLGASLVYYALVQGSLFLLKTFKGELPVLGNYEVAIQKSPLVIYERLSDLARYFSHMPPFNFETSPGVGVFILGAFVVAATRNAVPKSSKVMFVGVISGALMCLASIVLLLGSTSPWLLSKMDSLSSRHLAPWYLFFCGSAVGLMSLVSSFLPRANKWVTLIALLFFVLPILSVQYRLSMLEVMVTNVEIESIRSHLSNWVKNKGWIDKNYLLVVLPSKARPYFAEQLINNTGYGNENAVLATWPNPVSVPWMLHAVFREIGDRPKINLVDCASDQLCASIAVQNEGTVVLGYTKGLVEIRSPVEPFIINLSLLNSQPVMPSIVRTDAVPRLKASSTLGNFGPYGLLTAAQPGWHAERRPNYPQTLDIDLSEVKTFTKVRLLPQDGLRLRMPGRLEVSIRSENGDWLQVGRFDQLCDATTEKEGWHDAVLDRSRSARFVRLVIFQNCGDPELLTLKGLRFE